MWSHVQKIITKLVSFYFGVGKWNPRGYKKVKLKKFDKILY